MAKSRSLLGNLFLASSLMALLALTVHLWTYPYKKRPPPRLHPAAGSGTPVRPGMPGQPALPPGKIVAHLRMDSDTLRPGRLKPGSAPLMAQLVLLNQGPGLARILDAGDISQLLRVRLLYLGPKGQAVPRIIPSSIHRHPAAPGSNTLSHQVMILLPKRRLTIPVPMSLPFALLRPGRYRLEATYRSGAFTSLPKRNIPRARPSPRAIIAQPFLFRVLDEAPRPKGKSLDGSRAPHAP